MATKPVTDASFETEVLNSDKPVLLDFWAEWCGPCRAIAPALEALATDKESDLIVAKLNIDENPDTPTRFGVRGIPTLMLFKGGQLAATKVGNMAKSDLYSWVEGAL